MGAMDGEDPRKESLGSLLAEEAKEAWNIDSFQQSDPQDIFHSSQDLSEQ